MESFQAKGDSTAASEAEATQLALATAGPGAGSGAPGGRDAREALRFLFSKDGEFFREFLLEEVRGRNTLAHRCIPTRLLVWGQYSSLEKMVCVSWCEGALNSRQRCIFAVRLFAFRETTDDAFSIRLC